MSNLTIFTFEQSASIRVQVEGAAEVTWFNAADVAAALGYADPGKAVRQHTHPSGRAAFTIETSAGQRQATFIDEGNVYALILRSKLESAERFRHWLTRDVLPSIRKQGFYLAAPEHVDTEALALALDAVKQEKALLADKLKQTEVAAERALDSVSRKTKDAHWNYSKDFLRWEQEREDLKGRARWHEIRADSAEQVLASLDPAKQSDRTRAILEWRRGMLDALSKGEIVPTKFYD